MQLVSKLVAFSAFLGLFACSESKTSDKPTPEAVGGDGAGGEAALGPAYLMLHTVSSPEGRQNYVFVEPSLDVGDLDNKKGREISGASRAAALGGSVYLFDGDELTIERFNVAADRTLNPVGKLSVQSLGFSFFGEASTFVSPTRAYHIQTPEVGLAVIWDPSTMKIVKTIDVTASKGEEFTDWYVTPGFVRGDHLFSAVFNTKRDGDRYLTDPRVRFLVFDVKTDELVADISDDRCGPGGDGYNYGIDSNGDLYVVGDGTFGVFELFGVPKSKPACVLRIKAGETDFDPDFVQVMEDMMPDRTAGAGFWYIDSLGKFVTMSRAKGMELANETEYLAQTDWRPYFIDPSDWSSTPIEEPRLQSKGFPGSAMVLDGELHFILNPPEGDFGNILYRYQDGELKERVRATEWLQVVQRIR